MAEDQERILCDEVVRLQESVARLMDESEKDAQSIAHMADAVNKLGVRMTDVEASVKLLTEIALNLTKITSELTWALELEGREPDGNETGNESDGAGVVRDDGPEYEDLRREPDRDPHGD